MLSTSSAFPDPIPDIIPFGSICLFCGPPKVGKTAMLAEWLRRFRDGKSICGYQTNTPPGIGIVTTDHKWRLNQGRWFSKVGFADIPHFACRDDKTIKWRQITKNPDQLDDLLRRALKTLALPPGSLVAIDVMSVFITNRLNDYNEVLAGMSTVDQILAEFPYTGIGVGHMGKQKGDPKDRYSREHERILGSAAQIGFSDTVCYMLSPLDTAQPFFTLGILPTHAAVTSHQFVQDPATGLFEPLTSSTPQQPLAVATHLPSPNDLVVIALPTTPPGWKYQQVLKALQVACNIARTQAQQRLADLLRQGRIVRFEGRYFQAKPS